MSTIDNRIITEMGKYGKYGYPGTVPSLKNFDPYNQIKLCNFCGTKDLVFPVHSLNICPKCANRGNFENLFRNRQVILHTTGQCDLCKTYVISPRTRPALVHIRSAYACFKCLWTKLSKRNDALRPNGTHLV